MCGPRTHHLRLLCGQVVEQLRLAAVVGVSYQRQEREFVADLSIAKKNNKNYNKLIFTFI